MGRKKLNFIQLKTWRIYFIKIDWIFEQNKNKILPGYNHSKISGPIILNYGILRNKIANDNIKLNVNRVFEEVMKCLHEDKIIFRSV